MEVNKITVRGKEIEVRPITRKASRELLSKDVDFFEMVDVAQSGEITLKKFSRWVDPVLEAVYADHKDHLEDCSIMELFDGLFQRTLIATLQYDSEIKNS